MDSLSQDENKKMIENRMEDIDKDLNISIQFSVDIDDVITYAMVHNGANFVRDICLANHSDTDLDHIRVVIRTDNELAEDYEAGIEKIKAGEERHLKNVRISVNAGYLAFLIWKRQSLMTGW